jgi:hypothetical protein
VNLLSEVGVGVDLMMLGGCSGETFVEFDASVSAFRSETNEFHKRLSVSRLTAPNPRGTRNICKAATSSITSVALEAPGESGDRARGVSAKVKPFNHPFTPGQKCVEASDDVIKNFVSDSHDRVKLFHS